MNANVVHRFRPEDAATATVISNKAIATATAAKHATNKQQQQQQQQHGATTSTRTRHRKPFQQPK
jgi:hypothetical protein